MSLEIVMPGRILRQETGGNTTYSRTLADGLVAKGHNVSTLQVKNSALETRATEVLAPFKMPAPRILHYTADTGPLLRGPSPIVVTVHGVASHHIKVARNWVQETMWRARTLRALRSAHRIVTVSHSSRQDIVEVFGVPSSQITVIPHGVDHLQSTNLEQRVTNPSKPRLVYVGNIEPRKNIINLVRALEDPALRSLGVELIIAGRPAWNYEPILREIENSPYTRYLGFVSDSERNNLMRSATIFVFPSLYEGFGFPVLEALALGVPVVASLAGSLKEVAGPSLPIEDLSAEGIAHALSSALQDANRIERVAAEGPKWAAQFTWQRSVDAHESLYWGLVSS